MAEILFLAHRLPWPPDKGDKIRSFHLLRHLASRHRVRLGAFVDDPADRDAAGDLSGLCAELFLRPLDRTRLVRRALSGLVAGEPLSVAVYADPAMQVWVRERLRSCDLALAFSGQTARFLLDPPTSVPWLLDLVDCDSEKWRALAGTGRGAKRRLYTREADRLLGFERRAVAAASRTFLVTRAEADLLIERAPEVRDRVAVLENGVDSDFFAPERAGSDPWGEPGPPRLVFTGVMDYAPNVQAVRWFATEVVPRLRRTIGRVRLAIVGARPSRSVERLADPPDLLVTGRVPDVRPWIGHADLAVAPLRIARGVQNKVLEAMAMAKPVVASPAAAAGLHAEPGGDFLVADGPHATVEAIVGLLREPDRARAVGAAGRAYVRRRHDWSATLAPLDAAVSALLKRPLRMTGRASAT